MTYTTLTYNGTEKALADWNIGRWRREVYNQASDSLGFELLAATDGPEVFPYGSMITISTGRVPASGPSTTNAGLPVAGVTSWTGGKRWFVGWRAQNIRTGTPEMEGFHYKFAGPWDFFFERLVFQKLWLVWNGGNIGAGGKMIADWRSQVVLGASVNIGAPGDVVVGMTATNLMSISQQLKEIAAYVIAQSSYEQTVNGLGWPAGGQIQFDNLTTDANGNYHLLPAPGPNCLIPDFVPGHAGASGDTSVSTSGLMLRAPLDAVNDMTCAECFRRQLRWIGAVGSPVVWWDYTTTPPTLKVATRDILPGVTLPLVGSTESIKIQRRDDLIPSAIAFKYRISGQNASQPYTIIANDVAATVDGSPVEGIGYYGELTELDGVTEVSADAQTQLPLQARRFSAQIGTFDFEGPSTQSVSATIATAGLNLGDPGGGGAALAFWQGLFPQLAAVTNLAFYQDPAGAVAPTVLDPAGAVVNPANYPNILVEGNVCPWMMLDNSPTSNVAGQCVEGTITAYFSYTDNASPAGDASVNAGTVQCHRLTIKVKLTNLATGTYHSVPVETNPGEPVPFGLPGYIYGIETMPQYMGSFTVVEQEISDVCPMGNCLNLSGGLAEWGTMNGCVQQVNYDDTGKTELVFGPAQHLGNGDLVERLRVNRGPRWYNLIGGDLMNSNPQSGPTALGKNVPVSSPSPGNKVNSELLIPQSLKDLQTHLSGYTAGLPGVYSWTKGNGRSGLSLVDTGPGMLLAGGSGGTLDTQYVLVSVAQLLSVVTGQPVKFFELNTCEGGDATYYRTFLCTDKYHHT